MPAIMPGYKKTKTGAGKTQSAKSVSRRSADARFEAWLKDFDLRMADLTLRQELLMRKLGVEPLRSQQSDSG
jgi:hypothetical protein